MYRMTLADANALAVTKLLSPFHSSVTYQQTSLPLPRGHPSPSLLAKLYINIATLYTGARGLLKTGIIKTKSQDTLADSITIDDDIDSSLLSYLRKESILAEIRSRKWLGVEAGESGAGEKIGIAIAWLDDAKKRIKDLQDTGGTTSAAKGLKEKMSRLKLDGREERKERKGRLEVEGTDIEGFLKLYTHMNKTVSGIILLHRWLCVERPRFSPGTLPTRCSSFLTPVPPPPWPPRPPSETFSATSSRFWSRIDRVCLEQAAWVRGD